MPKRKAEAADKPTNESKMDIDGDDDSGSDDDASIINVDFEWFDFDATIDFHGIKTLLRQLFDVDHQLFDLSALSDLILEQKPSVGSTIKCDGKESDPYAFLTVLNLHHYREKPAVQELIRYLSERSTAAGVSQLPTLLEGNAQVGLIFSERFINMPHAVVPPLYGMLADEITSAQKTAEAFKFTHYLIFSKTYTEVASQLDAEPEQGAAKKSKKKGSAAPTEEVFYFHPEDEALQRHALAYGQFDYTKQGDEGASDAKRAFQELGIRPQGHMILLEAGKLQAAVQGVKEYLGSE